MSEVMTSLISLVILACILIYLDNRKGTCWSSHNDVGCEGAMVPYGITRDECCNTLGAAWGSPCQTCDKLHYCPPGLHHVDGRCVGKCRNVDRSDLVLIQIRVSVGAVCSCVLMYSVPLTSCCVYIVYAVTP